MRRNFQCALAASGSGLQAQSPLKAAGRRGCVTLVSLGGAPSLTHGLPRPWFLSSKIILYTLPSSTLFPLIFFFPIVSTAAVPFVLPQRAFRPFHHHHRWPFPDRRVTRFPHGFATTPLPCARRYLHSTTLPVTTSPDSFRRLTTMAGGYARVCSDAEHRSPAVPRADRLQVNPQDDDDHHESTPVEATPNSPPPSFRSRASSATRNRQVNADLEDAFGSDDDETDDETDDRQRLVSQTTPTTTTAPPSSTGSATQQRYAPVPTTTAGRVIGGGSGSDGVFANMSARPERTNGASEKDEQPPVRRHQIPLHKNAEC